MARAFPRSCIYLACSGVLALAACGGGSGGGGTAFPVAFTPPTGTSTDPVAGSPDPMPGDTPGPTDVTPENPTAPVTIAGKVVIAGAIGNATVCLDRNLNNLCDAEEPTASLKTGVDGAYSLTYTPTSAEEGIALAAAPLLARMTPNAAVDGGSYDEYLASIAPLTLGTLPPYLNAPAGRRTQINPLTTLVQSGVASGLSLGRSEASVGIQLKVTAAEINDYQAIPVEADPTQALPDNARTMAYVTAYTLLSGVPLRVVDPFAVAQGAPLSQLASLDFTDPGNYRARTIDGDNVVDSTGVTLLTDTRVGKSAGAPIAHDSLYPQARLTPTGWVHCDETTPITATLGMPNRSEFCGSGSPSITFFASGDLAGVKMTDTVRAIQLAPNSTIVGLSPDAGFAEPAAVFPAGSQIRQRRVLNLTQPYYINDLTADGFPFATLEDLIAARPAGAVNLPTGSGTAPLGIIDNTHILRGAFIDATTLQYYSCDSAAPFQTYNNCTPNGTGPYSIEMINGARVMVMGAGYPATGVGYLRSFAEYNGHAYTVRKPKSGLFQGNFLKETRLNGVAWEAMKPQIGL